MKAGSRTLTALILVSALQLSCMVPELPYTIGGRTMATGRPVLTQQNKSHDSFWQKIMKFFGISSNPTALRGESEGDETGLLNGSLWLVAVKDLTVTRLTTDTDYSSPVFLPQGEAVLALKNKQLVEVSIVDGKTAQVCSVPDVYKLVGFSRENTSVLVLTTQKKGELSVGLLSLPTCTVNPVPYDPLSEDDQRLLRHLQSWDREYGETQVSVLSQTKRSSAGVVEWTDIFVKAADGQTINVTNCDGIDCGQPSLSFDEKLLVFVKNKVR